MKEGVPLLGETTELRGLFLVALNLRDISGLLLRSGARAPAVSHLRWTQIYPRALFPTQRSWSGSPTQSSALARAFSQTAAV